MEGQMICPCDGSIRKKEHKKLEKSQGLREELLTTTTYNLSHLQSKQHITLHVSENKCFLFLSFYLYYTYYIIQLPQNHKYFSASLVIVSHNGPVY